MRRGDDGGPTAGWGEGVGWGEGRDMTLGGDGKPVNAQRQV